MLSAKALREQARALGFNRVGVIPARPAPHLAAYLAWVAANMHGEMGYLARPDRIERRRDLNAILPSVRVLIIVGLDYRTPAPPFLSDPARGRFATYAWGRDYHDLMLPRLEELAQWVRAESHSAIRHRAYVDTGAILERDHAQQAGLGFIGKNTLLIDPRGGSDFFLGEILTDADFDDYDSPAPETLCGTCTRCLAACPTRAFPAPYVLDARRCISYLTIELKDWIDRDLRAAIGNWVFGCDICQNVCPWNRFAVQTLETDFFPLDLARAATPLPELLALTPAGFDARYRGTPIHRIGLERLLRNAVIATGNSGRPEFGPILQSLLGHDSPLGRGHAAWALAHLLGRAVAAPILRDRLGTESHPTVREEIQRAIGD